MPYLMRQAVSEIVSRCRKPNRIVEATLVRIGSGGGMRQTLGVQYGRETLPVPEWSKDLELEDFSTLLTNFLGVGADLRTMYYYRQVSPASGTGDSTNNAFWQMEGNLHLNFKLAKILAHRLAKTGAWIADELKKGVIGKFEILSPAELVQALCVNGQTGMLAVQSDDTIGSLYFENGQMYEFQIGGRDDLEAFYDFLRWDRGVFRLQPEKRGKTVRRVRTDTMGLLLEGMRRRDEKSMGTGSPLSG
jgi:hypothetical protein